MKRWMRVIGVLVVVAAAMLVTERAPDRPSDQVSIETADGDERVRALFEQRRSGEMVEVSGTVEAVLPDDHDGSRHQRFIVRLSSGQTLLVAHNIDLAERVPLNEGDRLRVRGEYEWNDRGGVLHWTHHDPEGRRAGGWIEHEGLRIR